LPKKIEVATAVVPRMLSVEGRSGVPRSYCVAGAEPRVKEELRGLRMGHRLVFDRVDLDAFIEKLKRAA